MGNLDRLHIKVDDFFGRMEVVYGEHLACRAGCSTCCHQKLSLFRVELDAITAGVDKLEDDARARLADRLRAPTTACPLLESDRCVVYHDRPIICRSHGAPILVRQDDAPSRRDVCPLNFTGAVPLDNVAEEYVLDLDRLNALLAITNQLAMEQARDELAREPLDLVLARHIGVDRG